MEIRTARLQLVPASALFVQELRRNRGRAERLIAASIPAGWPGPDLAGFLPIYAAGLEEDPTSIGFGIWLVIEMRTRMLVGDAGFIGRPSAQGVVELGYSIHPEHRDTGYATEAGAALIGWVLAQEGVLAVVAECERDNPASIRVLEKIGMSRTGTQDRLIRWEIRAGA